MNHYERLKVAQDAPAEVIRAAYRALAAKLHPDRQNGTDAGGPDDGTHSQMAALNAAYEVLIDPKLRREYDASLLPSPGFASPLFATPEPMGGSASALDTGSTRVDLNWMPPGVASTAKPLWPPSRRMMLLGGSALAVAIIGTAGVMWQVMGQHQMEKAISNQLAGQPGQPASGAAMPATGLPPLPPMAQSGMGAQAPAPNGARRPSVEELARMSDEELLKVLPTLDEDSAVPQAYAPANDAVRSGSKHLLDGQPLGLRTDLDLVDPLAPAPAGDKAGRRP